MDIGQNKLIILDWKLIDIFAFVRYDEYSIVIVFICLSWLFL